MSVVCRDLGRNDTKTFTVNLIRNTVCYITLILKTSFIKVMVKLKDLHLHLRSFLYYSVIIIMLLLQPPVINNLPETTSMSEDLSTRTIIYKLNVTDVNVADTVTCWLTTHTDIFEVDVEASGSGM